MPARLFWFLFASLTLGVCIYIFVSSESLPAIVASKFDSAGNASGKMSRENYRNLMIGTVLFLAAMHGFVFWLVRILPESAINLPNKEWWLSPKNRDQTMQYITHWGIAMGSAVVLFFGGIHACVIAAHRVTPPAMPNTAFTILLGGIGLASCAMVLVLVRRFRLPSRK